MRGRSMCSGVRSLSEVESVSMEELEGIPAAQGIYAVYDKHGELQRISASVQGHARDLPELCGAVKKFFAIRHENGSHKGFGFSNRKVAQETQGKIERAMKDLATKLSSSNSQAPDGAVPTEALMQLHQERWKKQKMKLRGLHRLRHLFERSDIEIGYPTDVKHVAHIGWDGHSMDCSRTLNFAVGGDVVDASASGAWTSPFGSSAPPEPPSYFVE